LCYHLTTIVPIFCPCNVSLSSLERKTATPIGCSGTAIERALWALGREDGRARADSSSLVPLHSLTPLDYHCNVRPSSICYIHLWLRVRSQHSEGLRRMGAYRAAPHAVRISQTTRYDYKDGWRDC
jgi:hypothetical protein